MMHELRRMLESISMAFLCFAFSFVALSEASPIPSPIITGGSASLGGGFESANIFDGDLSTMYASNMQGVNTYLDFDFGKSITIGGMSQINNNIYDGITSSELIFSDDPTFSSGTTTVGLSHLTSVETSSNAFRFDAVTAQYARWQVTGIEGYSDTQGAREITFYDNTERGRLTMTHIADSGYGSTFYNVLNAYDGVAFIGGGTQWATNANGADAFMDFDLGSQQAVGGFVYEQRMSDYVAAADLIFSNDPTFSTVVATQSVTLNTGSFAQTSVSFDTVNARYVRFDATSVWHDSPGASNMYFVAADADVTVPDDLLPGVSVTATSQWSAGMIDNIVSGEGLSEKSSLGRHMAAGNSTGVWHAGPKDAGIPGGTVTGTPIVAEQEIIFDFGSNYDLESICIWNMNQRNLTKRGVDEFDLYVSSDDDTSTWTLVVALTLAEASGQDGEPAQIIPVNLQNVRLLKMDIQTAHSGSATEYVGLSEVGFMGIPSISLTAGDANGDGRVDDADATILATNWQTQNDATWAMGDFNNDGKINDSDATLLATNWQTGVNASAAVPEPSVLIGLSVLLPMLLVLRRKRAA